MAEAVLKGRRILCFVGDDYEDLELWYPKLRLEEAGAQVVLAGPDAGVTYRAKHGYPCRSDAAVSQMNSADFAGVVCPGGFMPDKLRRDANVLRLLQEFDAQKKMVAAICHGPWTLIEAGVVKGRTMTSWPSLRTDLVNAGAKWVDQEVVTDRGLVSSRKPADIPAFSRKLIEEISEGRHAGRRAA